MTDLLDFSLIGAIHNAPCPTRTPKELGQVQLESVWHAPSGRPEVWSWATHTLTFTAGELGIDDNGHLKIAMRWTADGGRLQMDDPSAANYVSATTSGAASLELSFEGEGHTRPFDKALTIAIRGGFLHPGETVTITLGDTNAGSNGMRLQSFAEDAVVFLVFVDAVATQHYALLPERLTFPINPASAKTYCLIGPTRRRVGEAFDLGIRAEDGLGNPVAGNGETFTLKSDAPVTGLPQTITLDIQDRATRIGPMQAEHSGVIRLQATHDQTGMVIHAPPLVIVSSTEPASYWTDLHAQSGETVGINTARRYFEFARDIAFLDATSHQANDFQINDSFWQHLNTLSAEFDTPGKFIAVPGYEWSGNTAVGGDRNVMFRNEGEAILRSSRALIDHPVEPESDAFTSDELFKGLTGKDVIVAAHIGGRYADIELSHDHELETAVEIHSCWGTFEWILEDAFRLGYRVGVFANSDDHKGRPGAAHPGASTFGAMGGLTCILADRLDRDSLFKALRQRHHYATTGSRIDIDLTVATDDVTAIMGDIVQTQDKQAVLSAKVTTCSPILKIEVFRGSEHLQTFRPDTQPGSRYRLSFEGSAYRGRGRQVSWQGSAQVTNAKLESVVPFNMWNPNHGFKIESDTSLSWHAVTSGNLVGCDMVINKPDQGPVQFDFSTPFVSASLDLNDMGTEETVYPGGGLDQAVRIARLADDNNVTSLEINYSVELFETGDTPVYIKVFTEDGHRAWTSPVYLVR